MTDTTNAGQREGPGRFLIPAVVTDYPKNRDWDRPGLLEAREQIVEVFTEQLGYRLHDALDVNPTKTQLLDALHAFCVSPKRREDDLLTVYLSCHGEVLDDVSEHVLLTTESDPNDLGFTALPTAELTRAMLVGTRIRRVLLLLDACYAGQGGNQMAAEALNRLGAKWGTAPGSGLVIVSSAQPHQQAKAGLFPQLLRDAINSFPVAGHSPDTLSLNAIVEHVKKDMPRYQQIGLHMLGLGGEPPAFIPNPRHDARLTEVDLALQQAAVFDEQDHRRETEFTSRLLVRAMGYPSGAPVPGWWFSGRHAALYDLATWLKTPADGDGSACRVVTGDPGSGKTAVLGLIAALTHPERRHTVPLHTLGLPNDLLNVDAVDTAVYAQRLTDSDVLQALTAGARVQVDTVGQLLDALERQARPKPLTVLIDALDEAATPETLCTTILRPLIEHACGRIRLLLGTRSYLLRRLGTAPPQVIDLDNDRYADPQALLAYTMRTLLEAHHASPYRDHPWELKPVGHAVARAAGTSFLIARITAGTLAAAGTVVPNPRDPAWQASLPRHASDAMRNDLHRRLGRDAQRATDLLRPLAYAQGQGLPWEDIWAPLATEISGRPYSDEDLLWLRHTAGSYVVEATESGRSAYRLYHQSMAEYLCDGIDPKVVHAAYSRVLTDRVPYRADATRDWSRAHPYTLNHLADHATQAQLLDEILTDSDYLVHATPRSLTPHLHQARSDAARLTAAIYRTSLNLHHTATPLMRRQILALDAARAGAQDLQQALTDRIPPGHWTPAWATGNTFTPALRDTFTGHTKGVDTVACTVLDGVPVAVTGGGDKTVRVWNLHTGQPIGPPFTGHTKAVLAVACTVLDGVPVAVTGGWDGTVRVWNLHTGQPAGPPFTGHTKAVLAVACTVLDGVPVAVTGGEDGTVRVWNLHTGQPAGPPLTSHIDRVDALACTVLDGVPVAVTGGWDGTVRVWNLHTGQPAGPPLTSHTNPVLALACTVLDGVPVTVTGGGDKTVRVWNLHTGRPIGPPLTGHTEAVLAVACTVLDGVPVAVTGGWDGTVRVWNLHTGQPAGPPLNGHIDRVDALACTVLDGVPVAITGGNDNTVRVWNLGTGPSLTGPTVTVQAVACTVLDGVPVAVTGGGDGTVRVWNQGTGQPIGQPFTGHTKAVLAVACTVLDGVPVAVTGGWDRTVRVWNLHTGQPIGPPLTGHTNTVQAVACTAFDGVPVAVTGGWDGTVRVWNLYTGQPIGPPLTGHVHAVQAVACTVLDGVPVAVTGGGHTVRVWNLRTGQPIGPPFSGHTKAVQAVACTVLNGAPVAVTGGGHTVRVWNLRTGQPIGPPFSGHTKAVQAVACTVLNGAPVAITGAGDNTVRVWDLRTRATSAVLALSDPRTTALALNGDLVVGFHQDIALYRRQPHADAPRT